MLDNPAYYRAIVESCDNKTTCSPLEVETTAADPAQCGGAETTNLMVIKVECGKISMAPV